jgi:alkanesulfonate monooxygenase SsuD/methylene tetrahydromethanopterin reductase-like flavin-dependent oxidoreductase (luciferase family)
MGTLAEDPEITKFVYWDNLTYAPPGSLDPERWDPDIAMELYESYLTHCEVAERLGYAGVSMPEHITPTSISGYPNVIMSALSQRTKTARIVSGVNIPLWHRPIDLAGEWAMIDVLSKGRLEIGLGRHGSFEDQQRALDIAKGVLHGIDYPMKGSETYTSLGNHVQPDDEVKTTLWPRPAQAKIPLWGAAGSEPSVVAAAKRGMNLFIGLTTNPDAGTLATPTIEQTRRSTEMYLEACEQHGYAASMANVCLLAITMVADTDEEAERLVEDGLINYLEGLLSTFVRSGALKLDSHAGNHDPRSRMVIEALEDPAKMHKLMHGTARSFATSPFTLIGSPSTVREKLEFMMSMGISRFILALGLGTPHTAVWEAAQAFATDVAPDLFAPTAEIAAAARAA